MLRVLIVDDEGPARDRLKRLVAGLGDVVCVGEAGDGATALKLVADLRPDVVFFDIQMPEMDGLTAAAALPDDGPRVVFTTAFEQHALRAFDLAAVDYLLKPIAKDRLAAAVARAREATQRRGAEAAQLVQGKLEPGKRRMAVRSGAKFVVFDVSRISAIVAQDHYATIFVDDKELLSDDPLDRLMSRLGGAEFLRVHRSAIVNLDFVSELQAEGDRKYVAVLSDTRGTRVPIARERLDEVKARLGF